MKPDLKKHLMEEAEKLDFGPFYFPDLYGPKWQALYIGDKVRLGHEFLLDVRKGDFPGIIDSGKKKGRGHIYLKMQPDHPAHL